MFCVVCTEVSEPVGTHPERITDVRKKLGQLDFTGIDFPIKLKDIDRFETQNPRIFINVLDYEEGEIFPLRINHCEHENVINL